MKQTDLLGVFEDGISKEKLRKIEMRKDALIILKVNQKYDIIAKRMESPIYSSNGPFVKLKDGRNLFEIEDYEIENINYVYELKFQEIDYLRIKVLSLLPELCKLEIKFSNIWLPDLKPEISHTMFFPNLQNLDLSFNNLTDEILYYVKSVRTLKTLNLMGNQITHEIPDLSELINLEELNLSSNNIVSYFSNVDMATNNYSENSINNNHTHVSHFNLMLSGKDFNNNNPNKDLENNENEKNSKEVLNLNDNNNNDESRNEIQKNNKNYDDADDAGNTNNEKNNIKETSKNIQNLSQINNNNNVSSMTQQTTHNNLKNSNDKELNENAAAKANNANEIDNNSDKISNQSHQNLTNDLKKITDHSNNFNNEERGKKTGYSNNNGNNNNYHRKNISSKNYSSQPSRNNMEDEMEENNQATVDTYEEWQKFLRTNLQDFYHKLSALRNLKTLNLSHNKIHFFDIDPYYIQQINGFSKLNTLDISYNLIDEEISILLVMNIPNLKSIDITCNPITRKKTAYENIEYEIFKTKNILLINSKPFNFNSQIWQPPNKIDFTRRKNFNKYANLTNEVNDKKIFYKVNSDLRIEPVRDFNKKIKSKITSMLEHKKKMDEEIIKDQIPEYEIDILENSPENDNENNNLDKSNKEEKSSIKSYLNSKKNKENVFLTNTDSHINKLLLMKDKNYEGNEGSENYINFLSLASQCFGKEKHYKNTMPISNAYQKLRFILNNLPTSVNENYEAPNRYMKPTISRSIHLDEYKPDNKNYKKEFKILMQMNKQQVINESRNEDNLNSSINLSPGKIYN